MKDTKKGKDKGIVKSIHNKQKKNKPFYNLIKDKKIMIPLIISLVFTIIIGLCISYYFSTKTDKILEEIKNITTSTNVEVKKITGSMSGVEVKKITGSIPTKEAAIDQETVLKTTISHEGTVSFWLTLNKPDNVYQRGYIFDIGDDSIKDRMSLFVDENGFLVWEIYESNYNSHALKHDINEFLKGEKFFIALTWSEKGEVIMYVNGEPVNTIKLDKLNLNISSEDMYWGSDMEGKYSINFG